MKNNTFDINKYIQLKKDVKQHYNDMKLGEQSLYENQSNLFKPITDITKEQTKAIKDKLTSNQDSIRNTLVPFTTNLEQRINQLENLQALPYYETPIETTRILDFDQDFTDEEKNYLASQKLDLPSVVFQKQAATETLDKIKSTNQSIGQSKRHGKLTEEEYNVLTSVIKKYKSRIYQIMEGLKIPTKTGSGVKLIKQRRSKGRPKTKVDAILYSDSNDLIEKLQTFTSSYKAGNKGVHNYIIEILDELMKNKVITKSEYDDIHASIFG